ncbi:MAG: chorismate-binding protein [Bacteroidetes bacterium]|nr:chorismate-binding protein [Bacteroidota bacterium]
MIWVGLLSGEQCRQMNFFSGIQQPCYAWNHQMQISTDVGSVERRSSSVEVPAPLSPAGLDETGAPKFRAMQIVENRRYLTSRTHSGNCGIYFSEGDFDFNLVIRSTIAKQPPSTNPFPRRKRHGPH